VNIQAQDGQLAIQLGGEMDAATVEDLRLVIAQMDRASNEAAVVDLRQLLGSRHRSVTFQGVTPRIQRMMEDRRCPPPRRPRGNRPPLIGGLHSYRATTLLGRLMTVYRSAADSVTAGPRPSGSAADSVWAAARPDLPQTACAAAIRNCRDPRVP
jgi:hypothetical protein